MDSLGTWHDKVREGGDVLRHEVAAAWRRQCDRASEDGESRWLALRLRVGESDPLAFFLAAADDADERFFWAEPEAGVLRAGAGVAWAHDHANAAAVDRFTAAGRAVADLLERIEIVGDAGPPDAGPVIQAGFSFAEPDDRTMSGDEAGLWAGFSAAHLSLAEHQLVRFDTACFESRVIVVRPDAEDDGWNALFARSRMMGAADGSVRADSFVAPIAEYSVRADRSHARFESVVREALAEIDRGRFEKVVVARALDVQHAGRFDLGAFLERLTEAYPGCTTFAVVHAGDVFVSASPERLVRLAGDVARTAALAGSATRGRTPESDEQLGVDLLGCPKNRAEHAAVVEAILEILGRHASEVSADDVPRLLKLEGIQHLETLIEAKLGDVRALGRPGEALLALVSELHPTPAVGGQPAAPALDWIASHEGLDRGWYAAPVGYITLDGDGEFRVALRSALLRETGSADAPRAHARLFAGAGIVAGSDPHSELVETRIKLRALLAPLTEI